METIPYTYPTNLPVSEPFRSQSISNFAAILQKEYEATTTIEDRKINGHFGTPVAVAEFMALLFKEIPSGKIRLLDAGAGVGILTAAVCDRIASFGEPRTVQAVLYEKEPALIPFLHETMLRAKNVLNKQGHGFEYRIYNEDFILSNSPCGNDLFTGDNSVSGPFDMVIMNPPYGKILKDSPHARVMGHVIHGQPNIYALFMAIGAQLLRRGGKIVAITPRSYCNGLYFRDFRKWFFDRITPYHIHLFESRTDTFKENGVLQENIILAGIRGKKHDSVIVTTSKGRDLHCVDRSSVSMSELIDDTKGDRIVRIAGNDLDRRIAKIVDSWPSRFQDMGFKISTGPVVTFRALEYIIRERDNSDSVPLLSMHNIRPFETIWPSKRSEKDFYFKVCDNSMPLLLPVKDYVILKRFTAKEEKRRLVAGIFWAEKFPFPYIGLENHLNYVRKIQGNLFDAETYGLAALFNSVLLDRYFRTINGNTQVNAADIRTLPLPPLEKICAIGESLKKLTNLNPSEVEDLILDHLGINGEIKDYLKDTAS
ncbi:MAG: Eco57I restriction-modification methylase domain-containing protein [Candidatus Latescibacter sp.]|nr:Eco57I restriction-modification methylase domain-containing protein [Candidatus Latescibacter sp.]